MNIKLIATPLAFAFATLISTTAMAVPTVTFGNEGIATLRADTPGQQISFFVGGIIQDGIEFDGLEFDLQIGDGGEALGGDGVGPRVTNVDLITGTVFENFGPQQADVVATPLAIQSTVDTGSLVGAEGLIATVTFDTIGTAAGDFDLLLTGVAGAFNTTFFSGADALPTTAINGTLRVTAVPEPSQMALLGVATVGFVGRWRRRRKGLSTSA